MKIKITKSLFFISILLSIGSLIMKFNGHKELYPFFYWKLYTQPMGNKYIHTDYKLYALKGKDTVRIPNIGYAYLNQDDYHYFLSNEASRIKAQEKPKEYFETRLFDFGQMIAPTYDTYFLIEETYNPLKIAEDSTLFTKNIIFKTK